MYGTPFRYVPVDATCTVSSLVRIIHPHGLAVHARAVPALHTPLTMRACRHSSWLARARSFHFREKLDGFGFG